jgi:hypothetical protein
MPAGVPRGNLLADLRHQLLDPPTPIRKPDTNITDAETVGAVA